jgi:CheY-like chemotaxis protein
MVLATHVDLLVSWGLEVVAADDGPAALRARGRGMLDAVVTDFRMPHMTGIELVETLRREDPLLPGIVVSGEAAPRWTALAAAPRRTLWLTKPVAPELLMDRLAAVICRRAACRRAIRAA